MNIFCRLFSQATINEAKRQGLVVNALYGKNRQLTQYFVNASEYDHRFLEQIKASPETLERSFFDPENYRDALCALTVMLETPFYDGCLPYLYPAHPELRNILLTALKERFDLPEKEINQKLYRLNRYLHSIAPELSGLETGTELTNKLDNLFNGGVLSWQHFMEMKDAVQE